MGCARAGKSLISAYADVPVEDRTSWRAYATREPGQTSIRVRGRKADMSEGPQRKRLSRNDLVRINEPLATSQIDESAVPFFVLAPPAGTIVYLSMDGLCGRHPRCDNARGSDVP